MKRFQTLIHGTQLAMHHAVMDFDLSWKSLIILFHFYTRLLHNFLGFLSISNIGKCPFKLPRFNQHLNSHAYYTGYSFV